jgi:hypothetical protein
MTITAAALISTLASQGSSSTNRQAVAAPATPQRPIPADTATISQASQPALASPTGVNSPTAPDDTTYNFADMTNAQVYNAAHQLGSEGKLSPIAEGTLQAMAADGGTISVPVHPALRGQAYMDKNMSSTTPQNYLNILKTDVADLNAEGNPAAAANYQTALTELTAYETTTSGSTVGGTISTTA